MHMGQNSVAKSAAGMLVGGLSLLGLVSCEVVEEKIAEEMVEAMIEAEADGDVEVEIGEDGSMTITGEEGTAVFSSEEGSAVFSSEEGEVRMNAGGEVPDDLGIALPSGGVVQSSWVTPDGSMVALSYDVADLDRVLGHFAALTDAIEDGESFTMTPDEGGYNSFGSRSEGFSVSVQNTGANVEVIVLTSGDE